MQLNVGLVVTESDVLSKLVEQHKSDCKAIPVITESPHAHHQ